MPGALNSTTGTSRCSPATGQNCLPPQPATTKEESNAAPTQTSDPPKWKKFLRGGLGILGGIMAYDIYYNAVRHRGPLDWLRGFDAKNYQNLGFDKNKLIFNRLGHALGGGGYDLSCLVLGDRAELESAGCSVVGSSIFEAIAEEKQPSGNDLIFTPVAGTALGGAVYLFAQQLRGLEPTLNLSPRFLGLKKNP